MPPMEVMTSCSICGFSSADLRRSLTEAKIMVMTRDASREWEPFRATDTRGNNWYNTSFSGTLYSSDAPSSRFFTSERMSWSWYSAFCNNSLYTGSSGLIKILSLRDNTIFFVHSDSAYFTTTPPCVQFLFPVWYRTGSYPLYRGTHR